MSLTSIPLFTSTSLSGATNFIIHVDTAHGGEDPTTPPLTVTQANQAFIVDPRLYTDVTDPPTAQPNAVLLNYPNKVGLAAAPQDADTSHWYLTSTVNAAGTTTAYQFPIVSTPSTPDVIFVPTPAAGDATVPEKVLTLNGGAGYVLNANFDLGLLHHATGTTAKAYAFPVKLTFTASGVDTDYTVQLQTANGATTSGATSTVLSTPALTSGVATQNLFKDSSNNVAFNALDLNQATTTSSLYETHITAASLSVANQGASFAGKTLTAIKFDGLTAPVGTDSLIVYSAAINSDGATPGTVITQPVYTPSVSSARGQSTNMASAFRLAAMCGMAMAAQFMI